MKGGAAALAVVLPTSSRSRLNQKRDRLTREQRYQLKVEVRVDDALVGGEYRMETTEARAPEEAPARAGPQLEATPAETPPREDAEAGGRRRRRRAPAPAARRGRGRDRGRGAAHARRGPDLDEEVATPGEPVAAASTTVSGRRSCRKRRLRRSRPRVRIRSGLRQPTAQPRRRHARGGAGPRRSGPRPRRSASMPRPTPPPGRHPGRRAQRGRGISARNPAVGRAPRAGERPAAGLERASDNGHGVVAETDTRREAARTSDPTTEDSARAAEEIAPADVPDAGKPAEFEQQPVPVPNEPEMPQAVVDATRAAAAAGGADLCVRTSRATYARPARL